MSYKNTNTMIIMHSTNYFLQGHYQYKTTQRQHGHEVNKSPQTAPKWVVAIIATLGAGAW